MSENTNYTDWPRKDPSATAPFCKDGPSLLRANAAGSRAQLLGFETWAPHYRGIEKRK